jgi:hypothetical protein
MAQEKAEEMSDVIGRLRSYESGEYGLREAVAEVQELRRTARRRDDEQGRLVQEANALQEELGGLLQENEELRQQLGLGPREAGRSAGPAGSDQLIPKVWFGFLKNTREKSRSKVVFVVTQGLGGITKIRNL